MRKLLFIFTLLSFNCFSDPIDYLSEEICFEVRQYAGLSNSMNQMNEANKISGIVNMRAKHELGLAIYSSKQTMAFLGKKYKKIKGKSFNPDVCLK